MGNFPLRSFGCNDTSTNSRVNHRRRLGSAAFARRGVVRLEADEWRAIRAIQGAKGCGEVACAGASPAVMNASVDALSDFGITNIEMPATPHRIWQAIQAACAA
jgi:hypothetical protein